MELKWLQDFIALVESQNFSLAAERRNITQPAFSRRIQSLEQWAGVELVNRTMSPLQLTPSGKVFEPVARDTIKRLLDSRERIKFYEKAALSSIVIATSHALSTGYFARWFSGLGPAFSDLTTRVISTNGHEGVSMLRDGNCDLLMSYYHQQVPMDLDPDTFPHITIGNDRLVPLCATDVAGQPRFPLGDVSGAPLPYLEYSANIVLARAVDSVLKRHPDAHLVPCYETDMVESLKAMMLAGRGIGWLPESVAEVEIQDGRLTHAFSDESFRRRDLPGAWDTAIEFRLYCAAMSKNPRVKQLWEFLNA